MDGLQLGYTLRFVSLFAYIEQKVRNRIYAALDENM